MTYIIAEPCVGTCDTACVEVCPVDCMEHVNLNVLLRLFLKRVKFQKNGVNLLKLTMIGLEEIFRDNKK